jgi:hypothetical protein
MKLTKEQVESARNMMADTPSFPRGITLVKTCEGWLAMRKMLAQLEEEQRSCFWCGAFTRTEDRAHGSECPLKELLG